MKTNRNPIVCMLLNFVTLGIYSLILNNSIAKDTNVICAEDGKTTAGIGKYIIFSLLTFGIYSIIWQVKVLGRWESYVLARNDKPKLSVILHVVLAILLSASGIAILIDFYLYVKGYNQVCELYNLKGTKAGSEPSGIATKNPTPEATPFTWDMK